MAKKPPTKSTAKKKTTTKKKTGSAAAKKTITAKKKTPKTAAKKRTAAKKPAAKKPVKKSAKKAIPVPELLKKKFEPWQPKTLYTAEVDEGYPKGFSAPPFVDESNIDEAKRIKDLVLKKIDLTAPAPKKTPAPEKPEAQAEPEEPEVKEPAEQEPPVQEAAPPAPAEAPGAAPEPPEKKGVDIPPMPAPESITEMPEESNTALKILIGCIASIFAVLLIASGMNMSRYHLKTKDNNLEIWKGVFSPTGMQKVLSLPGATVPERIKKKYSKKEVMAIAFACYLSKADALLSAKGQPDFKTIESYLDKAAALNLDAAQKKQVKERISKIKGLQAAPAGPVKPPQKGKQGKGQAI